MMPDGGRMFGFICGRSLVYNQCWEDPALDRAALGLGPADRVLVITSAGCNALDYALTGACVVAVDANPKQTHLIDLKLAGIRRLDFEDFFALFGAGGHERAGEIYGRLRSALAPEAQRFWDRHIRLFVPTRARGQSFYYAGTSGLYALAVRRYLERLGAGAIIERLLAACDVEEQIDLYRAGLQQLLLHPVFVRLTRSAGVLTFLGVPRAQRLLVEAQPGGFAGFLQECLKQVFSVTLLIRNYFWLAYLTGAYSREACPEYLKRENFERLKGGLVDNVERHTARLEDYLAQDGEPFSAFVLLDHMDWLSHRPDLLEAEWRQIAHRARPAARVIFRSGAPDARFLPGAVRRSLTFDDERARELHRRDRVGTYGSFHIARFAH
jgi:S-adenosylmethionine-diacylglycerol 3-amino-3-carboxypropyl transferase